VPACYKSGTSGIPTDVAGGARDQSASDDVTARSRSSGRADEARLRLLVVANETVAGKALLDEIAKRVRERPTEVRVVAPALIRSRVKQALGDVDKAREEAEERLERSLQAIRSLGVEADGRVGDLDPELAIEDALATFPADELIISTHPPQRSTWLERGVVERARERLEQPITHVVVDLEAERGADGARTVARIPRRRRRPRSDGAPDILPPMSLRDRVTIVVGIVGTIVLGVLALTCPDDGSFSGSCAWRVGIAASAFFVALWHSVALLLMGSVRYRGFWDQAAALMVLWGIPPAIVISALIG
jgi:hypothetical protein